MGAGGVTRVNVDDVAFMDRRFKLLGGRLAITWQEALGRCLPVWALCYHKRSAILAAGDIDALAERRGFAAAMLGVDLAAEDEGGLYLRGVADRIDFLLIQDAKREKARQAKLEAHGVASPRRPSRGTGRPHGDSPTAASPGTIPEEGPYSPDLDPDLDLDRDPSRAIPPTAAPRPEPTPILAVSPPAPAREDIARTPPIAGDQFEASKSSCSPATSRAWTDQKAIAPGDSTLSASPPPAPIAAFNPDDPRAIGRLAEATYRRVSDALITVAAELKLPAPLPFPAITPASSERTRDARDRVREEGAAAPAVCDRIVANLIAQAREERTVEWLAEKAFTAGGWRTARAWMPGAAARRRGPSKGDPLPPAPAPKRPDRPPPDPVLSPEDRAAIADLAARIGANPESAAAELAGRPSSLPTAELHKRYGDGQRAPPSSAAPTDRDPDQPRRKTAK